MIRNIKILGRNLLLNQKQLFLLYIVVLVFCALYFEHRALVSTNRHQRGANSPNAIEDESVIKNDVGNLALSSKPEVFDTYETEGNQSNETESTRVLPKVYTPKSLKRRYIHSNNALEQLLISFREHLHIPMLLRICEEEIKGVGRFWFNFEMLLSNLIMCANLETKLYVLTDLESTSSFIHNSYNAWSKTSNTTFDWSLHYIMDQDKEAGVADSCRNAKSNIYFDEDPKTEIHVQDLPAVNNLLVNFL